MPRKQEPERAVLVAADLGEYDVEISLSELSELARTAGAEVIGTVCQRRQALDSATYIGAGRLEEVREFAAANEVELLIFDDELTGTQQRNIEEITGVQVVDRTTLILDIFAQRATSSEGRLQVELAQQKYRLPRLIGRGTSLSRLGGGIGTRGPGETKLESDRRHIRRRIQHLEEELSSLKKRRADMRRRRKKNAVQSVAVVGYTNVGKSTLLNRLTGSCVTAQDMLFATLDPTVRSLTLPDGRGIVLVDTVGFVRRLPHHLVEAFQSTLEEALDADLILNVCDVSAPDAEEQLEVTRRLLASLGAGDTPQLTLLNKCDRLAAPPLMLGKDTLLLSAKTGEGLEKLTEKIAEMLTKTSHCMKLLVPYPEASLLAQIRQEGKVYREEYREDGILADALVDYRLFHKTAPYELGWEEENTENE